MQEKFSWRNHIFFLSSNELVIETMFKQNLGYLRFTDEYNAVSLQSIRKPTAFESWKLLRESYNPLFLKWRDLVLAAATPVRRTHASLPAIDSAGVEF